MAQSLESRAGNQFWAMGTLRYHRLRSARRTWPVRFWVAVTDNEWYRFLARQSGLEEVNFWHPSGRAPFKRLPEGTPFLFKLRAPNNHIAGGGFFTSYATLPLPLAWDAFGIANGAATYRDLQQLIGPLRSRDDGTTPEIGCSIVRAPVFWPRNDWIPARDVFAPNIVTGKGFDTSDPVAAELWRRIDTRMLRHGAATDLVREVEIVPSGYGDPTLIRPRRGQGAFQALVTNAYKRRCAITGEATLPVLEAAHIKPVKFAGVNNTFNGLLLRADFHKLFDRGLVTVTPELRIVVSSRIKDQWYNGKAYYRLQGDRLASLPDDPADHPRRELLTWHNDNVFERENPNAQ